MTRSIALAAGGTGGHLFPAVALAKELQARGHKISVLTDPRGAKFDADVNVCSVPAARMSGGIAAKAFGAVKLAAGVAVAAWHLRRINADLIVGFGGYTSAPPVLAAKLLRIPVVLHEQNAILGRANARLVRYASLIAGSFPGLERSLSKPYVLCGNPVRPEATSNRAAPYAASAGDEPFQLLIFGGSQGAGVFADILPKACSQLPSEDRARLRIVQQARPEDMAATKSAYAELNIQAAVAPFFTDLPDRMAQSHLVISRSGASTVAELLALGRPAIMVPYPHAMDDHQTANARSVSNAGGGWLVPQTEFSPENLAERLHTAMHDPQSLTLTAKAAWNLGRPDAAARLADVAEAAITGAGPAHSANLRSVLS